MSNTGLGSELLAAAPVSDGTRHAAPGLWSQSCVVLCSPLAIISTGEVTTLWSTSPAKGPPARLPLDTEARCTEVWFPSSRRRSHLSAKWNSLPQVWHVIGVPSGPMGFRFLPKPFPEVRLPLPSLPLLLPFPFPKKISQSWSDKAARKAPDPFPLPFPLL